jgi:formylglycine-generating enzyme required for sulfatase activity
MSGNVSEWVQDCFQESYDKAPDNGSAWQEHNNGDCPHRVLRGGSWNDGPQFLRAASRSRLYGDIRLGYYGFRVARSIA